MSGVATGTANGRRTGASVRLGFGCASMGSRKSAGASLAALGRAYDAGIDWFDVAPSYGDGAAEQLLGRFIRERGAEATICTKVGIAPGAVSLPKRLARPAIRLALAAAPGLRAAIKRRRPAAVKQPLTASLIATSIDASLARLGVERVGVLALHDATPDEVVRDDVIRAVEDVVTAGKAARIGIASSPAAARAGLAASPLYRMVQVANNPLDPGLALLAPDLADRPDVIAVTHSVFGAAGMVAAVARQIERGSAYADAIRDRYTGSPDAMARDYLADFAFSAAADVVLVSMFAADHLRANLARSRLVQVSAALCRITDLQGDV